MFIFILILTLFHNSIPQQLFGTETFRTRLISQTDLFEKHVKVFFLFIACKFKSRPVDLILIFLQEKKSKTSLNI